MQFVYLYYVTCLVDGNKKKQCAVNNIPVKKKFHLSQVPINCKVVHARIMAKRKAMISAI